MRGHCGAKVKIEVSPDTFSGPTRQQPVPESGVRESRYWSSRGWLCPKICEGARKVLCCSMEERERERQSLYNKAISFARPRSLLKSRHEYLRELYASG